MATVFRGLRSWKMSRDEEGQRTYDATFLVESDDPADGPSVVSVTPNLPRAGDFWGFGNDNDQFAYAQLTADYAPLGATEGGNKQWLVTIPFTTKNQSKRCKDEQIEDPLQIADRVSGNFVKYQEEATSDRFGQPIVNSAHEQVRGPQIEFDANRASIKIEQNVPDLQLPLIVSLIDHLNGDVLWGLPRRCVKFSNFSFEVKYQGQCYKYYTRTLEFDCFPETFDKDLLDEGTKALNGEWDKTAPNRWKLINVGGQPPNRMNPAHYTRYKDRKGENAKVLLDGSGTPYDPTVDITTGCAQCSEADGSTPIRWSAYAYDSSVQETIQYTLTYQTGCTWVDPNGAQHTLEYSPLGNQWLLTDESVTPNRFYTLPGVQWNCLGPNTMTRSPSSTGGPDSVIVYAQADSQPGSIHVEKYQEGNLLLLGIPTTI